MRLKGKIAIGDQILTLAADEKIVQRATFPACRIPKLTAYVDGNASGVIVEQAAMRPVIYGADGALIAVGDEIIVTLGQDWGWVDLPFLADFPGGVVLEESDCDFGLHVDGSGLIRIASDAISQRGTRSATDTYADGASDPIGAVTRSTKDLSLFVTFTTDWVVPETDDFFYARLPFASSQEILGNGTVVSGLTKRAVCGWHGTLLNEETGAFCIVKQGGALADYLGERVRVRARYEGVERSIVAYCHTQADIPDDLSLTRALFMRLAPAALDNLVVTVEVLA